MERLAIVKRRTRVWPILLTLIVLAIVVLAIVAIVGDRWPVDIGLGRLMHRATLSQFGSTLLAS